MKKFFLVAAGFLVLAYSGTVIAADDPDAGVVAQISEHGPHGGKVLNTRTNKVEVVVDRKNDQVHVFVLRKPRETIGTLSLTLLSNSENQAVVNLTAEHPAEAVPHYQGTLSQEVRGVVGVELHFSLPHGKKATMKAMGDFGEFSRER